MLQHKTTTPGGCQQAAAFVLPLTDKQGRGERCKGISRKGTIMCRNTAESRKLFYSGCILNIRASPHNSRLTAQAPLRRLRHGICVAKMLDKTSSIICAFGLASAVPRSPYRHLELCGIAQRQVAVREIGTAAAWTRNSKKRSVNPHGYNGIFENPPHLPPL